MRVAHISPCYYPAFAYGGPTRSIYGLTKAQASLGADVRVLTTNANGAATMDMPTGECRLLPGLRVRYAKRVGNGSVTPSLLRAIPELVDWADVVHLLGAYNFPTIPTLLSCRLMDKPLVWSPRGAFQRWSGTRRRKLKAVWEAACRTALPDRIAIHTTSESEASQARERIPAPVIVIANGVDLPRNVAHVAGNRLRMLFLGRVDPIKGLENLIEAAAILQARGLRFSLTIAGEGDRSYEGALRQLVGERALGQRVVFLGPVPEAEKATVFADADVFVLPSHSENFGLVVLEALAHGVPVIASDRTPWSSLGPRACGVWTPNDPNSLADAIDRMRCENLQAMGERGRLWVEQDFGWTAIGRQMLSAYDNLIYFDTPWNSGRTSAGTNTTVLTPIGTGRGSIDAG